jgi:hypothetical protein
MPVPAIAMVTVGLFRKTRALHEANITFLDGSNVTVTHRPESQAAGREARQLRTAKSALDT